MLPAQRVEPDVSKASPTLDAEVLFSQSCPVPNAGESALPGALLPVSPVMLLSFTA